MTGNPKQIPNMCPSVRRYPKFAPEAVTMTLLGPGVMEVETANESTGAMSSIIMSKRHSLHRQQKPRRLYRPAGF